MSNNDDGDADVVKAGAPLNATDPLFARLNARCIVSPGAMFDAATFNRFAVPDAPNAIVTVPDPTELVAVVDDENNAYVANAAHTAPTPAAPTATTKVRAPRPRCLSVSVMVVPFAGLRPAGRLEV